MIQTVRGDSGASGSTLPSGLPELLDMAFEASLFLDEGRPVQGSLFLGTPDTVGRALAFAEHLAVTTDRVRRLSAAIDYRSQSIRVTPELHVWGICERPTHMGRIFAKDSRAIIDIRGPADIGLSWAGSDTEARFIRNRYAATPLRRSMSAELPAGWHTDLASRARSAWHIDRDNHCLHCVHALNVSLWPEKFTSGLRSFPAIFGTIARDAIALSLRRIAERVRDAGHGGSILVLGPDSARRGQFVDKPGVTVSPSRSEAEAESETDNLLRDWASGLREYVDAQVLMRLAHEGLVRAIDEAQDSNVLHVAAGIAGGAHRGLDGMCSRLAGLAQMDGALLLDNSLRVLSFNSKLKTGNSVDLPTEVMQEFDRREVGSRHLSVACAAQAARDCVGIVVSQDGDATSLIAHPGARLSASALHL